MSYKDRDLQAPWVGFPKDYWDKDEEVEEPEEEYDEDLDSEE